MTWSDWRKWWDKGAVADETELIEARSNNRIHFVLISPKGAPKNNDGLAIRGILRIVKHKNWPMPVRLRRRYDYTEIEWAEFRSRLKAQSLVVYKHPHALTYPDLYHIGRDRVLYQMGALR